MTKLFISYKWESDEKNAWVVKLYSDLRTLGFDAIIDQYEVGPGDSFSDYMTKNISAADYVIFIITKASKNAVESGKGALAFEMQISNARKIANKDKFSIIPILREGDESPNYLSDHRYLDFRDDNKYRESLQYLYKWLHQDIKAPKIGYNALDPVDIMRVLRLLGTLKVIGWGYNYPKIGEKGTIILMFPDNKLEYISNIDTIETIWHKDFYSWTLIWDNDKGVVLEDRMAMSPD